ncbi:phosphoglycerate dehydrogenase-like enzyme [Rhizobium sp. BK313]|uniref:NAD(P)-dependent oxidoreductase n=1 Tax=Rhizobium sp. BK313 TaxID=2587081 RepID=UPI00105B8F60|nr:D-isomer specific 2-hydroxyacid dehydrogenase family protein [Rhizobium sp. BK313]MBB3459396.1 phosphoglycerate dehydrogenase-like enzyme [Rhizobium sp. BK313]
MTDVVIGMLFPPEPGIVGIFRDALPKGWSVVVSNGNADTPDFAEQLPRLDYLLVYGNRLERRHLERATRLRMIQKVGIGVDDLDVDFCRERGIVVAVCAVGAVEAVAEHALTLALTALKRIVDLDDSTRRNREWDRWRLRGGIRQLAGSTVGVVGYGSIGRTTTALMESLGAHVLVYARRPLDLSQSRRVRQCDSLEQLFEEASIVTLHVPLTAETRGMVGEDLLVRLGPQGILVNTARGAVVNEDDLLMVLSDGRLGFAALDVLASEPPSPDNALLFLPNLLLTPHVGGGGFDILRRKALFVTDNLQTHQAGRPVEAQAI